MTDLERALAHAEAMAGAEHRPDCRVARYHVGWGSFAGYDYPNPACPGCVSDTERALWRQLADEYAAQVERGREETLT